ncbi:MAG: hypothetical protein N2C14_10155 [Planctomycetales bacterium]
MGGGRLDHSAWATALAAFLLCGGACFSAEPGEDASARVRRLIQEMDDDLASVRQRAERSLLRIGSAAVPDLIKALKHPSAEVRHRARRILARVQRERLSQGFGKLAAETEDARIDLEEGMLLIAQIHNPRVRKQDLDKQLDALADKVRRRMGPNAKPAELDPRKAVDALRQVLFVEEKFNGARDQYDAPANSSLAEVLKTRRGLPILLSHLVAAVADRLELPMVGVPVPSRYMIKYDGSRVPAGFPKKDVLLNPYDGFREVSLEELKQFLTQRGFPFDPQTALEASSRRATLTRMLTNLASDYHVAGRPDKVEETERYRRMLSPE